MQTYKLTAMLGIVATLLMAPATMGLSQPAFAIKLKDEQTVQQVEIVAEEDVQVDSLTIKVKKTTNKIDGTLTARIIQDDDTVGEATVDTDGLSKKKYKDVTFEFEDAVVEEGTFSFEIEFEGTGGVIVQRVTDKKADNGHLQVGDDEFVKKDVRHKLVTSEPETDISGDDEPPAGDGSKVTLTVKAELASDSSTDPGMYLEVYDGNTIDDGEEPLKTGFTTSEDGPFTFEATKDAAYTVAMSACYTDGTTMTTFGSWKDNGALTDPVRTVTPSADLDLTAVFNQGPGSSCS